MANPQTIFLWMGSSPPGWGVIEQGAAVLIAEVDLDEIEADDFCRERPLAAPSTRVVSALGPIDWDKEMRDRAERQANASDDDGT